MYIKLKYTYIRTIIEGMFGRLDDSFGLELLITYQVVKFWRVESSSLFDS